MTRPLDRPDRPHRADEWYPPIVILKEEHVHFGAACRVDSFVKIEGGQGIVIGDRVHIASFAHVGIGGGELVVGDEAMIASGARILTGTNLQEGWSMSSSARPTDQRIFRGTTTIGPRAFIGAGATVLPGLSIGESAVVGAGAVVTKDIPAYEVWAGNPARRIGLRRKGYPG